MVASDVPLAVWMNDWVFDKSFSDDQMSSYTEWNFVSKSILEGSESSVLTMQPI